MPYNFNLPIITDLTTAQQSALNDPGAISVSGGPGTGKSVVSLWRHIRNYNIGTKRSLLLTYTVTLAKYLSSAVADENLEASQNVKRTYYWIEHEQEDFDEIIIDEAQDVEPLKYKSIINHAPIISYGADDQQIIFPEQCTKEIELERMFPHNEPYLLDENFRNSLQIMRFVRSTLPGKLITQTTFNILLRKNRTGNKPIVLLTDGYSAKQDKGIIDIINRFRSANHNIAILSPFKKGVNYFHDLIERAKIPCSKYVNDDDDLPLIENVHVTTFKSCKGTEFDTVIIPDFQKMKYNLRYMFVTEENDYYVAFTRAKRNLFLLSSSVPGFIHSSTFDIEELK
ncbi:DUF2075 domain-containing protein [Pedobacter sp. LMG 31464]|uniref:DNA 3'-5' helicase II n=1 Tax=Pedobacter planticolens TaxID=2679964 RepID=A0A923E188_9SPHI|nr:AAA domain-containing protein [Pedobacter planticolens]MBB2146830.1 DUF2075 domain-containing protein [Pedobacter planticolens]